MIDNQKIETNKKHWNKAFGDFKGWCALPTWGPFEIGKNDPSLIGDIEGKTFLEICCGSGHSIKYLLEHGAEKVYGLDFSEEQIKLAEGLNNHFDPGKAIFLHQVMEEDYNLPEKVDVVFSIYGMPWTINPETTLKNIFDSLKPGGKFVWSWDNKVFMDSKAKEDQVIVVYDYHDEKEILRPSKTIAGSAYFMASRKTSTWFSLLREAGFEISRYLEPVPIDLDEDISNISSPEMALYYHRRKAEKLPSVMIFECVKPCY